MNVIGIGTDICECCRIAEMIERHGEIFLNKVFTLQENEYCGRHRVPTTHYAGRWAAKEAILKALGTGWARGIHWTDLEIHHSSTGQPLVRMHGAALLYCRNSGIDEVLISISHTQSHAIAFAIATGIRMGESGFPNSLPALDD